MPCKQHQSLHSLFFIVLSVSLSGCVSHNKKDYFPKETLDLPSDSLADTACSAIHASYARCIAPIIQKNCVSCHSPNSTDPDQNSNVPFTDFEVVRSYAISKYDDREETELQTHVRGILPDSYAQMPPYYRLSEEELALLDAWIAAGAPPN